MNKDDNRHHCHHLPKFAPSKAVGPNEFEHALECNDCWAALIRWMDAEVINLPESADIRGRAKRLAGVAEIMATMAAGTGPLEGEEAIANEVFDDATLDDVLEATQHESRLVRGPWPSPRTRSRRKETPCANGKIASSSSPESLEGCTTETSTEERSEEGVCRRRRMNECEPPRTMAQAAHAVGPVSVALPNGAIEAIRTIVSTLGLEKIAAGLSTTTAETNVCMAVTSHSTARLCESCALRGQCRLASVPHLGVSFCVPLSDGHFAEQSVH